MRINRQLPDRLFMPDSHASVAELQVEAGEFLAARRLRAAADDDDVEAPAARGATRRSQASATGMSVPVTDRTRRPAISRHREAS